MTEQRKLPKDIRELVEEERKLLHNLSNPLAVASGMLEAYQDELARSGIKSTDALTRKLAKLEAALQSIGAIIEAHRPRLVKIQEAASTNKAN